MIAWAASAHADPAETRYIEPGAEWSWRALRAPRSGQQLGVIAAGQAERARQAARGDAVAPRPAPFGSAPDDWPGPDWPASQLAGADRGRAPFAARDGAGRCSCATVIGDERKERVSALLAQRRFEVAGELAQLRVLELRLLYRDGVRVWINGTEVAARYLPGRGPASAPAERRAGPEWESFYIAAPAGLLVKGSNRLSIEVRPSAREDSPHLDAELIGRPSAQMVRGPLVAWTGPSSATITFDTDVPTAATIEYRTAKAGWQSVRSAGGGLAVRHRVELSELPIASPVDYRVRIAGRQASGARFHTPPRPGEVTRFAVYGDMRGGHRVHQQIVSSLLAEAPDFVVVTGDLVLYGSDEGGWQTFFAVAGQLLSRIPFYPAMGNHDLGRTGDEQRRMGEIFSLPPTTPARPEWAHWYSFDVAGLHFVMLDSNTYEHAEQLEWLKDDLAAAKQRGAKAIFAAVHDGPYSRGIHLGNAIARDRYAPILADHSVTMLFSGHDHLYQRGEKDGLRYMVSGGGGAPLYPTTCGRGKRRPCPPDGAQAVIKAYHYIMVRVAGEMVELCPKRPDRSALEACTTVRLDQRTAGN